MRTLATLLAVLVIAYVAACAALFVFQRSLIYYPHSGFDATAVNRMRLPVDGAELAITMRPLESPKALLYFGGNAEDVSASLPQLAQAFPDRAI